MRLHFYDLTSTLTVLRKGVAIGMKGVPHPLQIFSLSAHLSNDNSAHQRCIAGKL